MKRSQSTFRSMHLRTSTLAMFRRSLRLWRASWALSASSVTLAASTRTRNLLPKVRWPLKRKRYCPKSSWKRRCQRLPSSQKQRSLLSPQEPKTWSRLRLPPDFPRKNSTWRQRKSLKPPQQFRTNKNLWYRKSWHLKRQFWPKRRAWSLLPIFSWSKRLDSKPLQRETLCIEISRKPWSP